MAGTNDDNIPREAAELWDKVFHLSNTILHQHRLHGFDGIKENAPEPNVGRVLQLCRFFDIAFDAVMQFDQIQDIGYDARRQVLNAKQQVTTMEQLATALQAGKQDDYENAVKALRAQAAF